MFGIHNNWKRCKKTLTDCFPSQEPANYVFDYSAADKYTGVDFAADEKRDGAATSGSYRVALPDGRVQTVIYTVDGESGFVAEVSYEGEAQYPEAPYKTAAPSPYHPAPAPYHPAPAPYHPAPAPYHPAPSPYRPAPAPYRPVYQPRPRYPQTTSAPVTAEATVKEEVAEETVTEAAPEATTEAVTESVTEAVTETATEAATESVTEAALEAVATTTEIPAEA